MPRLAQSEEFCSTQISTILTYRRITHDHLIRRQPVIEGVRTMNNGRPMTFGKHRPPINGCLALLSKTT
jgi:hypothetical protein